MPCTTGACCSSHQACSPLAGFAGRWRHVTIGGLHVGGALMVAIGIGIATQSLNAADGGWRWPWLYLVVGAASWTAAFGLLGPGRGRRAQVWTRLTPPLGIPPLLWLLIFLIGGPPPFRCCSPVPPRDSPASSARRGGGGRSASPRHAPTNYREREISRIDAQYERLERDAAEYRRVTDERIDTLSKTVADLEVQLTDQKRRFWAAIGYIRRLARRAVGHRTRPPHPEVPESCANTCRSRPNSGPGSRLHRREPGPFVVPSPGFC